MPRKEEILTTCVRRRFLREQPARLHRRFGPTRLSATVSPRCARLPTSHHHAGPDRHRQGRGGEHRAAAPGWRCNHGSHAGQCGVGAQPPDRLLTTGGTRPPGGRDGQEQQPPAAGPAQGRLGWRAASRATLMCALRLLERQTVHTPFVQCPDRRDPRATSRSDGSQRPRRRGVAAP